MYNKLIEDIINEANIKPEKVDSYGTNSPDFDNGDIAYNGLMKSYMTIFKVDEGFIAVAISRVTGKLRYGYSDNENIGRMLHLPSMNRRAIILESIKYLPKILYIIGQILNAYHMRIPQFVIESRFTLQDRYHVFLMRSPEFRKLMKRYRFITVNREKKNVDDSEIVIYTISKRDKG